MDGGTKTAKSETKLPDWYEDAAKGMLDLGQQISDIGYVPYMGPDVAAFTPQHMAGFQGTSDLASAFGMAPQTNVAESMPTPDMSGAYSSYPMFSQILQQLASAFPKQSNYLASFAAPQSNQPNQPNSGMSFRDAFSGGM